MGTDVDSEDVNLSQSFKEAQKLITFVNKTSLSSADSEVQSKVGLAIKLLEQCTKMVSSLQLFSKNESVEEITTNSLQYLLLPVMLGDMTNHLAASSAEARIPIVEKVVIYYEDFLRRCQEYELYEGKIPSLNSEKENQDLQAQLNSREDRVNKYKAIKETENKIKTLEDLVENGAMLDDETSRELHLLKIKLAIDETCGNLAHLLQEKDLLEKRFKDGPSGNTERVQSNGNTQGSNQQNSLTRPAILILTRDQVQKSVFGAGYPSVPTMTLDEWYESQCQSCSDTGMPERGLKSKTGDPELDSRLEMQEKIEREEREEERDEPGLLQKRRTFDDYKDDHRRGSGNTIGKG